MERLRRAFCFTNTNVDLVCYCTVTWLLTTVIKLVALLIYFIVGIILCHD